MALTNNQVELIKQIQAGLQHGDITAIATATGLSRVRVSQCINITASFFNEEVMQAAVEIISKRDKNAAMMLQQIAL